MRATCALLLLSALLAFPGFAQSPAQSAQESGSHAGTSRVAIKIVGVGKDFKGQVWGQTPVSPLMSFAVTSGKPPEREVVLCDVITEKKPMSDQTVRTISLYCENGLIMNLEGIDLNLPSTALAQEARSTLTLSQALSFTKCEDLRTSTKATLDGPLAENLIAAIARDEKATAVRTFTNCANLAYDAGNYELASGLYKLAGAMAAIRGDQLLDNYNALVNDYNGLLQNVRQYIALVEAENRERSSQAEYGRPSQTEYGQRMSRWQRFVEGLRQFGQYAPPPPVTCEAVTSSTGLTIGTTSTTQITCH